MRTARYRLREEQDRLLRLLPAVRWRLRHIPSISNIGVGAKEVGGEVTGEFAFRIYVGMKLPPGEVPRTWRIPARIDGIATDVLPASGTEALVDTRKIRPLKGGVMFKNEYVEDDTRTLAGTIGCLVRYINTFEVMALTCEHVLLAGHAEVGAAVGQPRYVKCCCCCTYNAIGTVFRTRKNDRVDCATVKLDPDIALEIETAGTVNEVEGIGTLNGVAQAVCFETVRKRGRTSELTTGRIVEVRLENSQILVRPAATDPFAQLGDSGSVLVNDDNRVVGLLWATNVGSRTMGIANHIGPVMQELEIVIAGETSAGLVIPTTRCPQPPPA